jgi:hypothetical protein
MSDRAARLIEQMSAEEAGENSSNGKLKDEVERPAIPAGAILLGTDEHRVVQHAIGQLAARDADLYQRGGRLVRVMGQVKPPGKKDRVQHTGGLAIESLPWADLRTRLTRHCNLVQQRGDTLSNAAPPNWLVGGIAAQAMTWHGVRPLELVTETPLLRPDGTILQERGYDTATGILFQPSAAFGPIPEKPTREDALRALGVLLEVVQDFPFAASMHRSAWVASTLTPLARPAFDGPSPLSLVDANVRGAGKGLLVSCSSTIAVGRPAATATYSHDPIEMRKVVTSVAKSGEPLILLDNVSGAFGNAALDAALTSVEWCDRLLGTNDAPRLPLLCSWFATSNNALIAADTARRVCHIRIESKEERPEERDGFTHPDLLAWVRQERPRLLQAALTILAAYCAAGRPKAKLKPWGSFEGWSDLIRQCIVWLGLPDPAATRVALAEEADQDVRLLRALMAMWQAVEPDCKPIRAATAIQRLKDGNSELQPHRDAMLTLLPGRDGGLLASRQLGNALRRYKGRVLDGRFFHSIDDRKGFAEWTLVGQSADSADSADSVSANSARDVRTCAREERAEQARQDSAESAEERAYDAVQAELAGELGYEPGDAWEPKEE